MLVPLAAADPPRGTLVNVVGTVNLFEAVKRRGIPGLAYASSAAVYDRADGIRVAEDADGHPISHYGVHKQANEGAARVYWRDDGVASVGLRPHIVYGPGRDHGMTAGPTLAILAAMRGEGYEIPFGGRAQFQYAPEAARLFIDAARSLGEGAAVRNLGGPAEHVADVIAAIEATLPQAAGTITFNPDVLLPLPEEMEAREPVTTPLEEGVHETIELLADAELRSPPGAGPASRVAP
jgi:UDP-glucuronate 4-epimerase